ncbi:DUF2270 domain-containing protein [Tropicimonas sediminicola]|uniref:Uncharacterized membrane protein n=1 Tax=Tropicimonas sediminicola TaxID=1031541 RepID=A0A239EI06_9RHOB|nr:DUF2270 domain-containing protein [Tropicimonas sediminicola]SNS44285.1 Uncharacterized membrane protein [Tropicimonas sediminicola]
MPETTTQKREFTQAEIGALAHLYRGEVYRSTIWRTRLDTTTNWSVVSLGAAISLSFSSAEASSLPLLLVGVLIWTLMVLESRRYRYFNVWRARARYIEVHFYAPMLLDGDLHTEENWQKVLAEDYWRPDYHVSLFTAMGRRIRRNYLWILSVQMIAYVGKLIIHPEPAASLQEVVDRADTGPLPGELILGIGIVYLGAFLVIAQITGRRDAQRSAQRGRGRALG